MGKAMFRIRDDEYRKIGASDSAVVPTPTDTLAQVKLYEVELEARSPSSWRIEDTPFTKPW